MLEVKDLAKSYPGEKTVLDDVSFAVSPGRLTALVGGKGSGKTTLLRILAGLLEPDAGEVLLDGEELTDRQGMAYLPQERGLYPRMRVAEQLVYLSRLRGMSLGASEQNADTLLERLELGDRAYTPLGQLSGGEQQRVHIAAALAHDPDVVLLDEPFTDLDSISAGLVFGLLSDHASSGVPILFATEHAGLATAWADETFQLADAEVTAGGRAASVAAPSDDRYEIETGADLAWLDDVEGVEVLDSREGYALFQAPDADAAQGVLAEAIGRGAVKKFAPAGSAPSENLREVV